MVIDQIVNFFSLSYPCYHHATVLWHQYKCNIKINVKHYQEQQKKRQTNKVVTNLASN